jgi:hypothetical protein
VEIIRSARKSSFACSGLRSAPREAYSKI